MLDEPDNGLDAKRLDALIALLKAYAAADGAAILASHDAALLDELGARVITLAWRFRGTAVAKERQHARWRRGLGLLA